MSFRPSLVVDLDQGCSKRQKEAEGCLTLGLVGGGALLDRQPYSAIGQVADEGRNSILELYAFYVSSIRVHREADSR